MLYVVSAYITGAALLIIFSQAKHILGVSADAQTAVGMIQNLINELPNVKSLAVITGFAAILLFILVRGFLPLLLVKSGMRARNAKLIARMAPIMIIAAFVIVSTVMFPQDCRH